MLQSLDPTLIRLTCLSSNTEHQLVQVCLIKVFSKYDVQSNP